MPIVHLSANTIFDFEKQIFLRLLFGEKDHPLISDEHFMTKLKVSIVLENPRGILPCTD